MRVCFIASCALFGGAERVLLETIDVLRDRGLECRVMLPGEGEFARELRTAGVEYAFLDAGSWVSWSKPSIWRKVTAGVKIARASLGAVRTIRAWRCDVIYSNTLTLCYGPIVARILGLPHVWHLHEFGAEDHGLFYNFGERFSNVSVGRMSSICIVVSQALAAKYRRYMQPSKLRVVYPSMHRAPGGGNVTPSPSRSGRFRIVTVGGLIEGKGQVDAAAALVQLRNAGIDAELIVVGDGDPAYRHKLEAIGVANGLGDRVRLVGRVESALPFIQGCDVVVVCSRCEAFGRATIEAMLAGKPVVGARSGATAELVRDGVTGLLYKCGSASDLAAKLRILHDDPDMLAQLGANGREWAAAHFTRARYGEEIGLAISSVLPLLVLR